MKTLLLTGFEPFLDFSINPTMKIVEQLHGNQIGVYQVHGEILPVDFATSASQLRTILKEVQPDAVISLGLAGGRYKITPERIAINVKDGEPDNSGVIHVDEPIMQGEADAIFTTLPIRLMVDQLESAGFPAEISNTAGTYLCNQIMYEGLQFAAENEFPKQSGFIHIPASHELALEHGKIPSWSLEDLKKSIIICIEALSEQ